ncbi:enoyl-CoA hydratase-related protein [Enterococcus casseliflavus]|uniref:enoyl-CoA hydratase-related protein n=1 Tax=Enterococcus casseliflavus TaxID=37734 RepID=UPI002DBD8A9F|nr:enoyl-CoA hydratase-related protein [Enterococcus casseliflavus]MEB8418502.1 enoyl-CoA hydratase-related protein [Enterococcus casseliflavus]
MKNFNTLKFEVFDSYSILYINRPKQLNSLNLEVLKELNEAIDIIHIDSNIKSLIICGSGDRAFVAGADIKEMVNKDPLAAKEFSKYGNNVFLKLENLSKPTIAAIDGFALGGGCELALACDLRIGTTNSKFGQPEVGLGIIPGFGGTQRLSRIVGIGIAKDLIYTGRVINSDEAYRINLLNYVVESEKLLEKSIEISNLIAKNGYLAIKSSKEAINSGYELPIKYALELEANLFSNLFSTNDQKEGMKAFIEKRKAIFLNK